MASGQNVPRSKAEHMAAPTNAAGVKKALANPEPSTHGPSLPSRLADGHGSFRRRLPVAAKIALVTARPRRCQARQYRQALRCS